MNNTLAIPPINIEGHYRTAEARQNQITSMALPYSSHPIYHLRKASLIIAFIGIVLCFITIPTWEGEALVATAIFLTISWIFCGADLFLFAIKKVKEPEHDPEWPTVGWMIGDAILAIKLQLVFWGTVFTLAYLVNPNLLGAYGALGCLLCSLLHVWSFWKQLMARSKNKWFASLPKQPCSRCGFAEPEVRPVARHQNSNEQPPNIFTYAGPSADFSQCNVLTPDTPDSVLEDGLLIGSDVEAGYGSIVHSEPTIEQPEEVVVSKGKKKAKKTGRDIVVSGHEKKAEQ